MTFSGFQEAFAHVNMIPGLQMDVSDFIPLFGPTAHHFLPVKTDATSFDYSGNLVHALSLWGSQYNEKDLIMFAGIWLVAQHNMVLVQDLLRCINKQNGKLAKIHQNIFQQIYQY
jgi:hypothetical protein